MNAAGERQYRTLGGGWVSEQAVIAGQNRWGKKRLGAGDGFAQQASLAYEMRKASSEEEVQGLADNFGSVARGWGMSQGRQDGAWIGAAFENQNKHLEYKRMKATAGGNRTLDYAGQGSFVDEIYENRGSYNLAQMGSNTVEQLKKAHADAQRAERAGVAGASDRRKKIAAIAETFMHSYGGIPTGGAGGAPPTIPGATVPPGSPPPRQANTPGAAHIAQRVVELAKITGVYGTEPSGYYSTVTPGSSPDQRKQS
jgi:hypothetical protein